MGVPITIMAANTTSGNKQMYKEPGIRIFQGLKPDICAIQEFNYEDDIQELITTTFGSNYDFYRESGSRNGMIPNGIIYRKDFTLLDKGRWPSPVISNRGFVFGKFKIPESSGPSLFIVSIHLSTKSMKQAQEALALMKRILEYYNVTRARDIKSA